jgi:hypothetical protein
VKYQSKICKEIYFSARYQLALSLAFRSNFSISFKTCKMLNIRKEFDLRNILWETLSMD